MGTGKARISLHLAYNAVSTLSKPFFFLITEVQVFIGSFHQQTFIILNKIFTVGLYINSQLSVWRVFFC